MKKYVIMLILAILLISGCKEAAIPVGEVIDQPETNMSETNVSEHIQNLTLLNETESVGVNDSEAEGTEETDVNKTTENNETETANIDETTDEEAIEQSLPGNLKIIELKRVGDGMQFVPKELTISQGTTVRWVNKIGKIGKSDVYAKLKIKFYYSTVMSPSLDYEEFFEYTFEEKGETKFGTVPYEAYFKVGNIIVE
ncbi:MAG: hypothetical protein KAU20_03785 [Nanoarchaeota archaeon]|nr:hypothetical protein [Nanoarchaeota archaeon]